MTAMNNTGSIVSKTAAEILMASLKGNPIEQSQILIHSELLPGQTTAFISERQMLS